MLSITQLRLRSKSLPLLAAVEGAGFSSRDLEVGAILQLGTKRRRPPATTQTEQRTRKVERMCCPLLRQEMCRRGRLWLLLRETNRMCALCAACRTSSLEELS